MPPLPTSSSSSYRSAINSPAAIRRNYRRGDVEPELPEDRLQRLLPRSESLVELAVADHERYEHADAVRVDPRAQQQQPVRRRRVDDSGRELRIGLLRLA